MRKFLCSLFVCILFSFVGIVHAAQVTLAWDANNPTPQGYRIFQRESGQNYNYSAPVYDGLATQTTITNLSNSATYFFVARAYTGTETSGNSNEVAFTSTATVPLSKVLQLEFKTSWPSRELAEYYGTTDQTLTCSWPAVAYAEGYEVILNNLERNSGTAVGKTSGTSLTFKLPKTGHYSVKVRACRNNYTECTAWSSSDNVDEAVVSGTAKGWIIYGTVAGAGPIIIE